MTTDALFNGLTPALVEDVLAICGRSAKEALTPVRDCIAHREKMRSSLAERSLVRHESDAEFTAPDVCGVAAVSGHFPLFGSDAGIAGACAVEGIVPDGVASRWESPRHAMVMPQGVGNSGSVEVLGAVASALMLERAGDAPHTLTLLDSTLADPFLTIVDALRPALTAKDTPVGKEFIKRLMPSMATLAALIVPGKKPRLTVGMPAHTRGTEFIRTASVESPLEDEALLTVLLDPGEYTAPIPVDISALDRARKLPIQDESFTAQTASIIEVLEGVRVIYIRPRAWTPALRVELPGYLADRDNVLALVVRGITHQCATSGLKRPFPLHRAEEMCAHLARACPAIASSAAATGTDPTAPGTDVLSLFATP